jgi:hypothetical protein
MVTNRMGAYTEMGDYTVHYSSMYVSSIGMYITSMTLDDFCAENKGIVSFGVEGGDI